MVVPRRIKIYIAGVTLGGAIALSSVLVFFPPAVTGQELFLAAVLTLFIGIASAYPVKIAPKVQFSTATAPIFVAVLLLPPATAVIVSIAGTLMAETFLKKSWFNTLFTTGATAIEVGIASSIYHLVGTPQAMSVSVVGYRNLLAILAVATSQYLVNTGLVSLGASLQLGYNPVRLWLGRLKSELTGEIALFSLGFVAALVTAQWLGAIAVLVVPVVIVYRAIERGTKNALLSEKLEQQLQELKQTQAQLVESAKLASLGTLAAGVAHEINNPMFAIQGRADLLLSRADEHLKSPRALHHLQVIREMSDRVNAVVRTLLSFSRELDDSEQVDLRQAMDDSLRLAGSYNSCPYIEIIRDYPPEPVVVKGSFSKLGQVFLNLILNARDAMPQGGRLTLQIRREDSLAQVIISDTGVGIPRENLERIFDPFFTTKEPGKGVGLGLFIAQGIVRKHQGTLEVKSEVGKGATFIVSLPAEPTDIVSQPGESAEVMSVSGSSSRSLAP